MCLRASVFLVPRSAGYSAILTIMIAHHTVKSSVYFSARPGACRGNTVFLLSEGDGRHNLVCADRLFDSSRSNQHFHSSFNRKYMLIKNPAPTNFK